MGIIDSNEKKITESKSDGTTQGVNIDPIIMKKIKILAPFLGETPEETINKALNHFLRLKSLQLDQAIEKLTEE